MAITGDNATQFADVTLIPVHRLDRGTGYLRRMRTPQDWRLYYYQGNFYWPAGMLQGPYLKYIRQAIKKFIMSPTNRALVKSDRALPSYRTRVQLFDEQHNRGVEQSESSLGS